MINISGIKMTGLPFGNLKLINEIMSFEDNPMLLHYTNDKEADILAYWVDFGENKTRWLYLNITKNELYLYLSNRATLKSAIENIKSQYIFLVDIDNNGRLYNITMITPFEIPQQYIPGENSYFIDGLSSFYEHYLKDIHYHQNLRDRSYIVCGKPSDQKHSTYLTSKQGALLLFNMTSSAESYVSVTTKNKYKQNVGNERKVNKIAGQFRTALSPLITEADIHSFEVWLSMDTITLNDLDKIGIEIKAEILEGYKKDVLDVDFTSKEDAEIICTKYNAIERKAIYGPIIELLENDKIEVTISDKNKTIRNTGKAIKTNSIFKDIILPQQTLEEAIEEQNRKNRIFTLVVSLKEGTDIATVSKKQLLQNLLSSANDIETSFPIKSPIEADGLSIELKKPIEAALKITEDENLEIVSSVFEISSKGNDIKLMKEDINRQFIFLVSQYVGKKKTDIATINLLQQYIDLKIEDDK